MELPECLVEHFRGENQQIVYVGNAKQANAVFKPNRLVVMTDQEITLWTPDGKKSRKTAFWLQLTELSFEKDKVVIKFGKKGSVVLKSDNLPALRSAMYDGIQRLFKPFEFQNLFDRSKTFVAVPNSCSILARIKQNLRMAKLAVDDVIMDRIEKIFNYCCYELDLEGFPQNLVPIVIDGAVMSKHLKSITFPDSPEKSQVMTKLVSEPNQIKRIHINGATDAASLAAVFKAIKTQPGEKLYTIAFTKAHMKDDVVELIKSELAGVIEGLELHDALHRKSANSLYSFIPALNLKVLNLSDTKGLDVTRVMRSIPTVWFLSLANCDIEISELANFWDSVPALRGIDLSGNKCSDLVTVNGTMGRMLVTLILDDVEFRDGCLEQFFRVKSLLKLSIANVKASQNEWMKLFQFFRASWDNQAGNVCRSLISFKWDRNPIFNDIGTGNIFDFLRLNDHLEVLSVNYCVRGDDASVKGDVIFSACLDQLRMLRTLSVHGMGAGSFVSVVELLKRMKTVPRIDVSFSTYGENAYTVLTRCLAGFAQGNPNIGAFRIICDGVKPEIVNPVVNYLMEAKRVGVPVSFPDMDLAHLCSLNKCSLSDVKKLRAMMAWPEPPVPQPPGIEIMPPRQSGFDLPHDIYYYQPMPAFPYFLSRTESQFYTEERVTSMRAAIQSQQQQKPAPAPAPMHALSHRPKSTTLIPQRSPKPPILSVNEPIAKPKPAPIELVLSVSEDDSEEEIPPPPIKKPPAPEPSQTPAKPSRTRTRSSSMKKPPPAPTPAQELMPEKKVVRKRKPVPESSPQLKQEPPKSSRRGRSGTLQRRNDPAPEPEVQQQPKRRVMKPAPPLQDELPSVPLPPQRPRTRARSNSQTRNARAQVIQEIEEEAPVETHRIRKAKPETPAPERRPSTKHRMATVQKQRKHQ